MSAAIMSLGPDRLRIEHPYTTVVIEGLRTVSESNRRGSWRKHYARTQTQRFAAYTNMKGRALPVVSGPVRVKVTRIAPRALDAHDNLRASLKAVVDGIADWLKSKDNDPRITWDYGQERGKPRQYAVRVEVWAL